MLFLKRPVSAYSPRGTNGAGASDRDGSKHIVEHLGGNRHNGKHGDGGWGQKQNLPICAISWQARSELLRRRSASLTGVPPLAVAFGAAARVSLTVGRGQCGLSIKKKKLESS